MKYYKAINDKVMFLTNRTKTFVFVKNELLTEKELKSYCDKNKWNFDKIVECNFSTVEISKRQIYYSFGCRFCITPSDEC